MVTEPKEQKPDDKKCRVLVGNLPMQEKELKGDVAENIKGGGGAAGGVVMREDAKQVQIK